VVKEEVGVVAMWVAGVGEEMEIMEVVVVVVVKKAKVGA
jgi:hypothetical protein